MVSKTVKVNNSLGIHLRPAGKLADAGIKFSCTIQLVRNEKVVNGKSLLSILSLGIKKGYEVQIQCDGKDEQEALDTFVRILEENETQ